MNPFTSFTRRRVAGWLAATALPLHTLAATAQPATPVANPASDRKPLRVVASFSILADMAAVVGGDAVVVQALVPNNADAHVFSPKPAHAQMLAGAELVVMNGLGFEGWMQRLVQASGYKGPVLELGRSITPRTVGRSADPHAWQDLGLAQRYVASLRDAFAAARPQQAAGISERAARYQQQMQTLDAQIRQRVAALPADRRRVVSPHDAFAYFGAAYGVEFLTVRGRNADSEASAADVARLITQLRKQQASAVFVENISDPRLLERIAQEAQVAVGGRLYSDALSASGTEADTYLKMFTHNAQTILSALEARR